MRMVAAGLVTMAALCWSPFAAAGPVVDAATRAEALQAEGKTAEALDALEAASVAICEASQLAFRKVVVVDSSEGFGVYSERPEKTFKPDEKLKVYVEPVCLGAGSDNSVNFTSDLTLENSTGQVLAEKKDLFALSAPQRRQTSVTLSFDVPYLRPGEYKATFMVHDKNSPKTGTFEVPFTIALPTPN